MGDLTWPDERINEHIETSMGVFQFQLPGYRFDRQLDYFRRYCVSWQNVVYGGVIGWCGPDDEKVPCLKEFSLLAISCCDDEAWLLFSKAGLLRGFEPENVRRLR